MKQKRYFPAVITFAAILIPFFPSQLAAADDPAELVKLTASFNRKVRSVLEPLILKYKVELEKVEKKLAAEGRLEGALRVREVGRMDFMGMFAEDGRSAIADVGQQKSKVAKALTNTVWTMRDRGSGDDPAAIYMFFQPDGIALIWGRKIGTWKVLGSRKIELKTPSWGLKPMVLDFSDDLTTYTGTYSGDGSTRRGELVAIGVEDRKK